MCVTGLAVVDTGTYFSTLGLDVLLTLIQLGGLGIMTFTTLIIHLLGKHVSLGDRIAVGQSLLRDPSFSLPKFLSRVVIGTFLFEAAGALCLWLMDRWVFPVFGDIPFHFGFLQCRIFPVLGQPDAVGGAWRNQYGVHGPHYRRRTWVLCAQRMCVAGKICRSSSREEVPW